MKLSLVWTWR